MTRWIGIFTAFLLLSACAATEGERAAEAPNTDELDLAVSWGDNGHGEGFIVKPVPGAAGQFRLRLYYRDPFSTSSTGVVNRCFGHWDTQPVEGDTGKQESGGYWRINCASGRSAEGVFAMDAAGNGSGEGFDQQGQPVRLFFGSNAASPKQE